MTETAVCLGTGNKYYQHLLSESASETTSAFLGTEHTAIATWYLSLCGMGEKEIGRRCSGCGSHMRRPYLGIVRESLTNLSDILLNTKCTQTPDNGVKKGQCGF